MNQPYFGPPDATHHCAHRYRKPELRCPNHIDFLIRRPGENDLPACFEHLAQMIWDTTTTTSFAPTIYTGPKT